MSIFHWGLRFAGNSSVKPAQPKEKNTQTHQDAEDTEPPAYPSPPPYELGLPPAFENHEGDVLLLSGRRNACEINDAYEQWIERQQALFTARFPEVENLNDREREERFSRFLEQEHGSGVLTSDFDLDTHPPELNASHHRQATSTAVMPYRPTGTAEISAREYALAAAIHDNIPDLIEELMRDEGVNINARFEGGVTPMHMAAVVGNPTLIRLLAENGADVNAMTESGSTPLHTAAQAGRLAGVRALLSLGADPALRDQQDRSALNFAVESGNVAIMAALFGIPERF